MSEQKYTPGPWHHYIDDDPRAANPSLYIAATGWGDVAKIGGGPFPTRLANARLIAAAPELHEALSDMIDRAHFDGVRWTIESSIDGVIVRAREALAKAEA